MGGATSVTKFKGAQIRCSLRGVTPRKERILLCGETLGATFPFTGEGIGKAMETGELAAQAIHSALVEGTEEPLATYEEGLTSLRRRYDAYEAAEKARRYPLLWDLVAWRASRSLYLRALIEGIVDETTDPRRLFSPLTLVRSFTQ
jgi:flavin-dependent dehydrogenase